MIEKRDKYKKGLLSRLQPRLALAVGLNDKDRCEISSHHDVVSFLLEPKNTTFYIYQTSLFLFYFELFCSSDGVFLGTGHFV